MLGIWIGKLVTWLLRMRGMDATSFPGKIALKFSPRLLAWFGRRIERVIVVTGTNGKTTTTSLLAAMMQHEEPVITNHKGANLLQGIATAFLQHASWTGKLAAKTAVLEVDEATFPLLADSLPIVVIAVTNVFRDQLDRYGELDVTVDKLFSAIRKTDACLVLNADDPICRNLGLRASRKTFYYGMSRDTARAALRRQMRDGQFCMNCGHELVYDAFWYGQLGLYRCPSCDFSRPHPEFIGVYRGKTMALCEAQLPEVELKMPVQGLYNAYNVLAAASAARVVGLWAGPIHDGLADYNPPDGRMQSFDTKAPVTLNLVKNPTGCDSVVQAVVSEPGEKVVVIGINDLAADGRDVSWLWDADFELFAEDDNVVSFITSGYRAEDMALRLKYAGIDSSRIRVESDMDAAMDFAIESARLQHVPVFALCTYTLLHKTVHTLTAKARDHERANAEYRASVS
ncbi:MurT ligase domain-containing protein [Alicyclobacillus fastidiosus]|uniref:Lipid II isoglutaminyl synthase (glutamine-hydrolyzing) subunit MurT n=1 Tax=Alicyclobacillus fastidiosus TaxID=392011 RepID=A0ABY6ZEW5_9BACL|nr:Mur ligase family protein [Alicyclobacillus fastidiosus]WAH40776.1 MurT ligase domain-containing protein [Alicyclobacillus fastidiosus]GMA62251.1 UDP-N-acetylmuramyl peptide synthase [Alicyclobacillus fastidiosus]